MTPHNETTPDEATTPKVTTPEVTTFDGRDGGGLLEATGLTKTFRASRNLLGRVTRRTYAVQGVDLTVGRGQTYAVVGESGAGKSTVGRLVLRLIEPDAGRIVLDGIDIRALHRKDLRHMRKRMQMIFQDPYSSLDPRMVIEDAVGEALTIHFGTKGDERRRRVLELLDRVGIRETQAGRYPHEFSGGQLQRIAIARALAVEPDLIVCDEPVAALDVSIRAQVINLLDDLQQERGVAYIFISHDLSLVRRIADRVAVMYQGRVVEEATPEQLYTNPHHPYTRALLDVIPIPDPRPRTETPRTNTTPKTPTTPTPTVTGPPVTTGCAYTPRCPHAHNRCHTETPTLRTLTNGHKISCHLDDDEGTVPVSITAAESVAAPRERRLDPEQAVG